MRRSSIAKGFIHGLLLVYALILAYILSGLIFNFYVQPDIFFDLSFALLFFTLVQCFYELGAKKAVLFIVTTSIMGFLAELLGTSTGIPFGKYYYTDLLGPKVFGVPEFVPLIWFVIAYLTFSVARNTFRSKQLSGNNLLKLAIFAAFGAVAWDLLIDPMFTSYGYWVWTGQFLPLPELDGIPLTNFVGWFALVTLMLLIYFSISKSKSDLTQRKNAVDSQLAYFLLIVDGTIANWALMNYFVMIFGVSSMVVFLVISYYGGERQRKIESPSQVIQ